MDKLTPELNRILLKTKDYTQEKLEKVVNKLPMFKEKEIIYNFYYQEILLSSLVLESM